MVVSKMYEKTMKNYVFARSRVEQSLQNEALELGFRRRWDKCGGSEADWLQKWPKIRARKAQNDQPEEIVNDCRTVWGPFGGHLGLSWGFRGRFGGVLGGFGLGFWGLVGLS